jgi:predicted permease
MNNVILLLACFALGIVLRASGRLPDNAPAALNGFVINVSLPALTLVTVRGLELQPQLALAALTPWLLFGLGVAFFWSVARALKLPRPTMGALVLTGAMANTSFIGIPMIETWYGAGYVGVGIVIDQLGSYMTLSTLGLLLAAVCASRDARFDAEALVRKLLRFAPFVSLLVALALTSVPYPEWLETLLRRLAATLVPLALVSVGMQLRLSQIRGRMVTLSLGLAFKLAIGPALVLAVLAGILGQRGPVIQVSVFEAAMGPMIGAAIVAMDHDLDPGLVTLMVGIGVPLSFATLPAWWWLLQGIG